MIVVATQIKLKNIFKIVALFRFFSAAKQQLRESEGLLFSEFRPGKTLTGWKDLESMKRFRNSGAHLDAMKHTKALGWAKTVTWECLERPSWTEAMSRLDKLKW